MEDKTSELVKKAERAVSDLTGALIMDLERRCRKHGLKYDLEFNEVENLYYIEVYDVADRDNRNWRMKKAYPLSFILEYILDKIPE